MNTQLQPGSLLLTDTPPLLDVQKSLRSNVVVKQLHYFNSFAPAKIAKKNVRKVAARKTVIINHN